MRKRIQDVVKNAIFHHSKYDFIVKKIWVRKSKVFIVSKRPEALSITFNHLGNVESTKSKKNIMILIFDKASRKGADNRCQVPVIGTKT